jgi:hypothetical protein
MGDGPAILLPGGEKQAGQILTTLAKTVIALEMGGLERSSIHGFVNIVLDQDTRAKAMALIER